MQLGLPHAPNQVAISDEVYCVVLGLPKPHKMHSNDDSNRLRWQIELAFKRLKSLLHIDRLPTWTERGSRSWLYAHLILALLCDDLSQDFLESSP